ncbi:Lin-37-like protein [Gryllus bimaculatus]|nr:Lin-37-like protein [Gryllus bimaculatus]
MGKRRKLSTPSTSSAPSPRMRIEIKEEKTYSGGGDIVNARDRLKGALQEILDQSDDSSTSSTDELLVNEAIARQQALKKEALLQNNQNIRNLRQQQRRRRRRELLAESAFHHTYVMKLFDRSVDLAQFKEDTPLYPVCRAWMANQPHNTNLVPKLRTPTPEPPPDESNPLLEGTSGSGDDADLVRDTYKMPPPLPLPDGELERKRLRIPSPILREHEEIELDYEVKPPVPRDTLLRDHIMHWTAVRKKWHETTKTNAARYEPSARILKAIYKKAQKAFE